MLSMFTLTVATLIIIFIVSFFTVGASIVYYRKKGFTFVNDTWSNSICACLKKYKNARQIESFAPD